MAENRADAKTASAALNRRPTTILGNATRATAKTADPIAINATANRTAAKDDINDAAFKMARVSIRLADRDLEKAGHLKIADRNFFRQTSENLNAVSTANSGRRLDEAIATLAI